MEEAIFIGTFVPLTLMLGLLRHSRPVFGSFCWGMASFLIVYLSSPVVHEALGVTGNRFFTAVFVGPPIEELLKPLPLFIVAIFAVRSIVPFFYILGLSCGIGFAIEENLIYLVALQGDVGESRTLMVLRSFSTCLMHGVATGLTGYSLTMARRSTRSGRFLIPIVGLCIATIYHSGFNWLMLQGFLVLGVVTAFTVFVVFLLLMKEFEARAPETRGTMWE